MNYKILDEIEELLDKLKSRMSLIDGTDLKFIGYHNWLDKREIRRGLRRGSVYGLRTKLESMLSEIKDGKYQELDVSKFKKLKVVRNISDFLSISLQYLEEEAKDELSNKTWLFYFLHLAPPYSEEPYLGKTILKTGINGKAELKNLNTKDDPYSEDYFGSYSFVSSNIVMFDLKSDDGERVLHIKLSYQTPNDTVMIAMYNTFDRLKVQSGKAVLEQTDRTTMIRKGVKPSLSNFRKNRADHTIAPLPIKEFLRFKSDNIQILPSPPKDLGGLARLVDEKSRFRIDENSFLELDIPYVTFSSPVAFQRGNKQIEAYTDNLSMVCTTLSLKFKVLENESKSAIGSYFTDEIEILRKTRVYVTMLNNDTVKPSFFLRLGFALSHVKKVVVIYEQGLINSVEQDLKDMGVSLIEFNSIDNLRPSIEPLIQEIKDTIMNMDQ